MRIAPTRRSTTSAALCTRAPQPVEQLEGRTLFATFTWEGLNGTDWSDAASWVGGQVPGNGDDVVLPANAASFNVNVDVSPTLHSLTVSGDGYGVSGSPITLGSGGIVMTAGSGVNTVSTDLHFVGGTDISVAAGSLSLTGTVTGDTGLNVAGPGYVVLYGNVNPGGPFMTGNSKVFVQGAVNELVGIDAGGTLMGEGYVDVFDALSGSFVSPGYGAPGVLSTAGFAMESGSTLSVEIHGTTAGTGYDQFTVAGNAGLDGSLDVSLGGYVPALGDEFVIVDNSVNPVTGTFAGTAEGANFGVDGVNFQVSYAGGADGMDVTLTAVSYDTTTTIAPSIPTAPFSQPITFTATVTAPGAGTPTGTVRFYDGMALLGTAPLTGGQASIPLSTLGVGGHTVTAVYSGDGDYNGSTTASGASVTITNNAPTSLGTVDVDVTEDAPETTVDLTEVFEDVEDADDLNYSIVGTTNTSLFSFVTLDGSDLTFTFTADAFGTSDVTVRATDSDGAQADAVFNVNVGAAADPGRFRFASAAYSVTEGGTAQLTVQRVGGSDGAATVDFAVTGGTATRGDDFTLADGTLTFADGETSKVINVPAKTDDVEEGPQTLLVTLSEPGGGAGLDSIVATTVTITDVFNHAPSAGDFSVTHAPGATATVSPLAHASDADGDAITMSVLLPPSRGMATLDDAGTPADPSDDRLLYTPTTGTYGDDSFVYQVTDSHGKTATGTVTVRSQGIGMITNVTNPALQDLVVVGTDGNDDIRVYAGRKKGDVKVTIDGESMGNFRPTGRVIAFGGEGDDTISLKYVKLGVVFYGGAGNDDLEGSRGADVLIGGTGDDTLRGWEKRDILIGGTGADAAVEKKTDDVLIGDGTAYDADTPANRLALFELLATWNGKGSAAARINKLTDDAGPSLGDANVDPDGSADVLAAATKKNWVVDLDAAA